MAQVRLRDYQEPLTSFNHNIIQLRNKPGRFIGFDTLVQTATLGFNLSHAASGTAYRNEAQNLIGPVGVLMSRQGVYIIETDTITGFLIDTNAGNTNDRIDLVVCNHQFVNVAGGQNATYSIIKGPIASSTPPNLTNPDYQIIVGRITMPAGATNVNQATYIKERCPDSGDGIDARLNEINKFAALNQFNFSPRNHRNDVPENLIGAFGWTLDPDGNNWDLAFNSLSTQFIDAIRLGKDTALNGTTITIQITDNAVIRSNVVIPGSAINRGYSNIVVPNQYANKLETISSQLYLALQPTDGNIKWNVTLLKSDNQWIVINVQGYSFNFMKPGMVIEADLSNQQVVDNFDDTGLGKNLYLGWQMCNGLRGTRDRRCRFSVMASDGPNLTASALSSSLIAVANGDLGGNSQASIQQWNLPTLMFMQIQGKGIKKSGTSNGVIALGTATVAGASIDATYGDFTTTNRIDNPGGGTPFDVRPHYVATFFLMKL